MNLSTCCSTPPWLETDLCSSCKEHADFYDSGPEEVQDVGITCEDKLKAYTTAINKIDDYFEYRYQSDQDKQYVITVVDELIETLMRLALEGITE